MSVYSVVYCTYSDTLQQTEGQQEGVSRSPGPLGGPLLLSMMSMEGGVGVIWDTWAGERLEIFLLGPHNSMREALHPSVFPSSPPS